MSIVISVLLLAGLILLHEAGHFVVAKATGVRVQVFSIGFGPKLLSKVVGGCEYRLSALPLGGYVKLHGYSSEPGEDDANAFSSKPVFTRLGILLAGPAVNLLLPLLILPAALMIGFTKPAVFEEAPVVGWVDPGSPGADAMIVPGDLITGVGQASVSRWEEVKLHFTRGAGKSLHVNLKNGDTVRSVELTPRAGVDAGYTGIVANIPPVIGPLDKRHPAAVAGLRTGDLVAAVNGTAVGHWFEMTSLLASTGSEAQAVTFSLKRDGVPKEVTVTPVPDPRTGEPVFGFAMPLKKTVHVKATFPEALRETGAALKRYSSVLFSFLGKLFSGKEGLSSLSGPVSIIKQGAAFGKAGPGQLLAFAAFLSFQLGLLNLLPIPALDGGHSLFLLGEALFRKPIPIAIQHITQNLSMVMLLVFIAFLTWKDVFSR